ncbi:MAG: uracil phosphoribosyltransferase, partial [Gemmataceae bacterium]|nr:uracil phosphoribosyltransferase [Gemmataceae bacterium]
MAAPVYVLDHPLMLHHLGRLRSQATPAPEFRTLVTILSQGLFLEATRDLTLLPIEVTTPLAIARGGQIQERIAFVPVLRAGLGMAEAMLAFWPAASVWHLGLYRDHDTLRPITYSNTLPPHLDADLAFVLDPMLATGGSAVAAIDILKRHQVRRIRFLSLIAAPEGIRALQAAHPDVPI